MSKVLAALVCQEVFLPDIIIYYRNRNTQNYRVMG